MGQADPIPGRWITILDWRQWIFVLTVVVWQGQLWNLPEKETALKKKSWFSSWAGFWTSPGWLNSTRWMSAWWDRTVACSARPLIPHLWRVVSLVMLLYALLMTHNVTNPCKETEIHVTSLCRGMGRLLNYTLKYCSEWDVKICQVEPSDRRWWSTG